MKIRACCWNEVVRGDSSASYNGTNCAEPNGEPKAAKSSCVTLAEDGGAWIEETVESNSELDPDPEMIKIESFGDEAKKSEKHSYRELVTETWSYKWLVASLRLKFLL